jgi:hypothetical protein
MCSQVLIHPSELSQIEQLSMLDEIQNRHFHDILKVFPKSRFPGEVCFARGYGTARDE